MDCPKCRGQLEEVSYQKVRIDRCKKCDGLWFDFAELQELLEMDGAESIDVGSPVLGGAYNGMQRIDCPVCKVVMIPMSDDKQQHINYEICSQCYGVFLDAGEFSDLKEFTAGEWLAHLKNSLLK